MVDIVGLLIPVLMSLIAIVFAAIIVIAIHVNFIRGSRRGGQPLPFPGLSPAQQFIPTSFPTQPPFLGFGSAYGALGGRSYWNYWNRRIVGPAWASSRAGA